jgi:hypothetical protein
LNKLVKNKNCGVKIHLICNQPNSFINQNPSV